MLIITIKGDNIMLTGYKTITFALLLTIFGALETFDFTSFLSAENAGIVTTLIGGAVAVLRYVTKTPLLNK